MKKLIFLIVAVLLTTANVYSQWVQQPAPTTNSLEYIHFLNNSTGFVAGGNGLIMKTTNGGTNWVAQTTPTTLSIEYIYFFDMNTAIAVCSNYNNNNSAILKTINGGVNWVTKFTNTHIALRQTIQFINPSTGYTGGWSQDDSVMIKTTDAGESWKRVYLNGMRGIDKINILDANMGYAAGYNTAGYPCVLKTTDGGANWTKIYTDSRYNQFMSMHFVNVNTGWVVGISNSNQSLIQKTTNGGLNWVDQVNQHPSNWELYNIQMLNENTGWIIGDIGQIVKTTNGGVNWRAQNSISLPLWGIDFISSDTGWVVGYNGLILKTVNGGGPVSVQNISTEVPSAYSLKQNYPNPFNPATTIKFDIAKNGNASIKIFDMLGNEIVTLLNERLNAGTYTVDWNASEYPTGVYFYRLQTDGSTETKKDVFN